MKIKSILAACFAFAPLSMFAQSSLTIFSEDGYRFYLVLNGQKQNNTAVTNIHIDGLTQPYYSTKIIFEDGTKKEISKNVQVVDPGTNAPADVTYKIKTQKDGDIKMRYFSATPVAPNYVAPPDMYVMHYGTPPPPPAASMGGGTTVTQTTVTQTVDGGNMNMGSNGGASLSVGVGGMNMNVNMNISDPTMNTSSTTVTRTTTTTTSSGYGSTSYDEPAPPPPPARSRTTCYAMNASDFRSAKDAIGKGSFEDTKLSTAKTILTSNCMSTDQIMEVCKMFSFEQTKLDFAKQAYGRCSDPGSYFKVGNIFTFDASRTELNEYIGGGN